MSLTRQRSAVVVYAALALVPTSSSAQPPAPRPTAVVDNGEFMDLFLKTTYGELQQAMAKPPPIAKDGRRFISARYRSRRCKTCSSSEIVPKSPIRGGRSWRLRA